MQIRPIVHALVLITIAVVASAQTFRGTILGTITDPNGAVVAGATIKVRNTSTGLQRTTTTKRRLLDLQRHRPHGEAAASVTR